MADDQQRLKVKRFGEMNPKEMRQALQEYYESRDAHMKSKQPAKKAVRKAEMEKFQIMQTEKIDVIQPRKGLENMSPPINSKQQRQALAEGQAAFSAIAEMNKSLREDEEIRPVEQNRYSMRPPDTEREDNPNVSPQSYKVVNLDNTRTTQATRFQGSFGASGAMRKIQWEQDLENQNMDFKRPEKKQPTRASKANFVSHMKQKQRMSFQKSRTSLPRPDDFGMVRQRSDLEEDMHPMLRQDSGVTSLVQQ
jgi:hypothetical protein